MGFHPVFLAKKSLSFYSFGLHPWFHHLKAVLTLNSYARLTRKTITSNKREPYSM